jgi:WD40-like Beta Propeller Repeat
MNKQLLINNLKAAKRSLKEVPEMFRAVGGYMDRRVGPAPKLMSVGDPVSLESRSFREGTTQFPARIVTPTNGHFMTTFFDVDAFSPSGRYLAVTQVPFINRIPIPGDVARICVVDIEAGSCEAIYETTGWGTQLGANVQWGADNDTLFCNDVVNGRGTGVRIHRVTRESRALEGPIYGLSPDRRYSYGPNIEMVNAIIPGYGVPDPFFGKVRQTDKISATEGIWRTDLKTGKAELFLSLADIVPRLDQQEGVSGGRYYVFNVKVNAQNTRIFAVLFSRKVPGRAGWPVQLITANIDGSDVRVAMPDRLWRVGGHHPSWAPDGDHILMNLRHQGGPMAFVSYRYDGSGLQVVAPGHKGSGHPSLHPTQDFLLTDSYISEGFKDAAGDVPLRLIDLSENAESEICRVFTNRLDGPRRVDPHPVWSKDGNRIAFNAVVDGFRQVVVVDMSSLGARNGQ